MTFGVELSAHCHNRGCNQFGYLNRVTLVRRLGMDHSCMAEDLQPYVYCPKCREAGRPDRNIGFTGHAVTVPYSRIPGDHPVMLPLPAIDREAG